MIDIYPWFALLSSIGILVFVTVHLAEAIRAYQRWHDDRAAIVLLIGLTLFVVGFGLVVSAAATFLVDIGTEGRAEMRNLGLAMVRGAMFVGALTLFLVDIRTRESMR